jgi:dihydrofolate reductase
MASSADGFVADENGKVDFLNRYPMEETASKKFSDFMDSIDVIVMGSKSYLQLPELSPDEWLYKGKKIFVFSDGRFPVPDIAKGEEINFCKGEVDWFIDQIKSSSQKAVWLFGGANIVKQFHDEGFIDEYIITFVPDELGKGIELFKSSVDLSKLKKVSEESVGVFVEKIFVK